MDFAVFIGRFQPFHNGHRDVIACGLRVAQTVIVLVGSATGARRPRNPWSFDERVEMITESFPKDGRVICVPLRDYTYRDDHWIEAVQSAVSGIAHPRVARPKIALIGHSKDESGYYLNRFPQWDSIDVEGSGQIHSTDIRQAFFERGELGDGVPGSTATVLARYYSSPEGERMRAEWQFIKNYKESHDNGEYHRNNVTADAVVVQAGHVLMVRRGAHPGKGMLALPGGHVGRKEHPTDAALRELREETRLKVPESVLRGSIVNKRWFDDPYRSDLCRTYTKAIFIRLENEGSKLARVRGGDDAAAAMWVPLSELRESECFDDHFHIIGAFIGSQP